MDPYENRTLFPIIYAFGPDIEDQAFRFGHGLHHEIVSESIVGRLVRIIEGLALGSLRTVNLAHPHSVELVRILRRHEALALCVRYTLESIDLVIKISFNSPVGGLNPGMLPSGNRTGLCAVAGNPVGTGAGQNCSSRNTD